MITGSANFTVNDTGSPIFKTGTVVIECQPLITREEFVTVECHVLDSSLLSLIYSFRYATDQTAVNAVSPSATDNFDMFYEAVQMVVANYLDALPDNSAVTFSIV